MKVEMMEERMYGMWKQHKNWLKITIIPSSSSQTPSQTISIEREDVEETMEVDEEDIQNTTEEEMGKNEIIAMIKSLRRGKNEFPPPNDKQYLEAYTSGAVGVRYATWKQLGGVLINPIKELIRVTSKCFLVAQRLTRILYLEDNTVDIVNRLQDSMR